MRRRKEGSEEEEGREEEEAREEGGGRGKGREEEKKRKRRRKREGIMIDYLYISYQIGSILCPKTIGNRAQSVYKTSNFRMRRSGAKKEREKRIGKASAA